jgi:hypothetical protein
MNLSFAMLQNHVARLIQNAVMAGTISQVQTNGQLGPHENLVSVFRHGAILFISRSLFQSALSASILGTVSHPVGDRPSDPICETGLSVTGIPFRDAESRDAAAGICDTHG